MAKSRETLNNTTCLRMHRSPGLSFLSNRVVLCLPYSRLIVSNIRVNSPQLFFVFFLLSAYHISNRFYYLFYYLLHYFTYYYMIYIMNTNNGRCDPLKIYMKCKMCGNIDEAGKIKTVCSACGALSDSFESYTYDISGKRLERLKIRLHPMLVHFPQSIALLSLIFLIVVSITAGKINTNLVFSKRGYRFFSPFSIFAAMSAGVLMQKCV